MIKNKMSFLLVVHVIYVAVTICHTCTTSHAQANTDFTFNDFRSKNLTLDGVAEINSDGLLFLTNRTKQRTGHAFYPTPIIFKNSSTDDSTISFSTSFVFGILPEYPSGGHGISFVIAPQPGLPGALPLNYLGLFNATSILNYPNLTNHVIAVEFDTVLSPELNDINDNHVGIDIDSPDSVVSFPAGYYSDNKAAFVNVSLISDESRRVWIEYDGVKKQMNVTIAPINMGKPSMPLLSLNKDISHYFNSKMYVGFAAATGTIFNRHYLLGWSFKSNGQADELDISMLPKLPISKMEIAVKRMSQETWQGKREFVSEIVSIGRLRHRNLVQLMGYCRRKKELLLVYEYMCGGSLDKILHNNSISGYILNWSQRFAIIKGIASGLFYLHEGWEQVVIHRDVKASNVLLDSELNGKLGDFGLARLHDHGSDPNTTQVVGTLGYLAPEQMWTGKVSQASDVFGFGAFLLEVACGRKPVSLREERFVLIEWVFRFWLKGLIWNAVDPNLGGNFDLEEVELVMKVGLLCSNMNPSARPTMRQVVEYLERHVTMPELSSFGITLSSVTFPHREGIHADLYPSTSTFDTSIVPKSLLSRGR